MLKVRKSFMATDENGNEVLVAAGDIISEISDAGPWGSAYQPQYEWDSHIPQGWNVTVRFTPSHKLWNELVTVDAVKLLKALED